MGMYDAHHVWMYDAHHVRHTVCVSADASCLRLAALTFTVGFLTAFTAASLMDWACQL